MKKLYTDPNDRRLHLAWLRARAQANYRNEEWHLTLAEYFAIWSGNVHRKGRGADCLVMTKIDLDQPWQLDNVHLQERRIQLKEKNQRYAALRAQARAGVST